MRLQGRAALVTGGSSGIGAAIGEELAAQGASVTLSYFKNPGGARSVVGRIEQLGRQAMDVRADVRRKADVQELFRRHLERFGRLDILVNNAGDMVQRMPTTETPETVWRDALDLNLSSVFFCCQEALPRMTAGAGSSISRRLGLGPAEAQAPFRTTRRRPASSR
jgi:3-oxoacyl-[acyl-carrier protein] reductase